jgi:hypothetical protein
MRLWFYVAFCLGLLSCADQFQSAQPRSEAEQITWTGPSSGLGFRRNAARNAGFLRDRHFPSTGGARVDTDEFRGTRSAAGAVVVGDYLLTLHGERGSPITLTFYGSPNEFLRCRSIDFFADGPMPIGRADQTITENLGTDLGPLDFERIAYARVAKVRLCNTEVVINQQTQRVMLQFRDAYASLFTSATDASTNDSALGDY